MAMALACRSAGRDGRSFAFLAYAFAISIWFRDRPLVTVALMGPEIVAFLTVAAKTTRGGWRWRWGDDD